MEKLTGFGHTNSKTPLESTTFAHIPISRSDRTIIVTQTFESDTGQDSSTKESLVKEQI